MNKLDIILIDNLVYGNEMIATKYRLAWRRIKDHIKKLSQTKKEGGKCQNR